MARLVAEAAAQQGFAPALFNLGLWHRQGHGGSVRPDPDLAADMW
jgi:TPR repeat protein